MQRPCPEGINPHCHPKAPGGRTVETVMALALTRSRRRDLLSRFDTACRKPFSANARIYVALTV